MLYRQLIKQGSIFRFAGFGCMRLPTIDHKPEKIDYPKATQLLHYGYRAWRHYVDTAYFIMQQSSDNVEKASPS